MGQTGRSDIPKLFICLMEKVFCSKKKNYVSNVDGIKLFNQRLEDDIVPITESHEESKKNFANPANGWVFKLMRKK